MPGSNSITDFSVGRNRITCKERENFPSIIEEGSYQLKTNRLDMVSSCRKSSYRGEEMENQKQSCICSRKEIHEKLQM